MRVLLAVLVVMLVLTASAEGAAKLPGKYGCSLVIGQATNPTSAQLKLKASGRYVVRFLGVGEGSSSSGTWKRHGEKVRFKGGRLGGDVATRRAHPVFMARVQLAFRSFDGDHHISCLR